ncbi:hypothetical protein CTA2_4412 [Colletotrichum tanaceti]|uniref:Uncharacterized protein n=1 Tax=Colletotrichum tanaceti TaxID=1306861 RepID=A0A4U6XDY5_9PEZI|nr:hypothetical protein CTA2_4412 [Colletotrichum tanaceti]TKW53674.1 hypothetical protein CTA1_5499 [Colletotrichum tanaceti]
MYCVFVDYNIPTPTRRRTPWRLRLRCLDGPDSHTTTDGDHDYNRWLYINDRAGCVAGLLCLETIIVVVTALVLFLVLFDVAYPDRLCSPLWRNGGEEGWCSNPRLRMLTTSNTATEVLGATVFFARLAIAALQYEARWTCHVPRLNDALLAFLWARSAATQNEADFADPLHLSEKPWIAKWEILKQDVDVARIVGALEWSRCELGKRAGMKSVRKMDSMLDQLAEDAKKWVATYKDEVEEEDWSLGHEISSMLHRSTVSQHIKQNYKRYRHSIGPSPITAFDDDDDDEVNSVSIKSAINCESPPNDYSFSRVHERERKKGTRPSSCNHSCSIRTTNGPTHHPLT